MSEIRKEIYIHQKTEDKLVLTEENKRETQAIKTVISSLKSSLNIENCALLFTLKLLRISGRDFKERLSIEIFNAEGESRGKIYCSPLSIESDLYQLREHGVLLSRSNIMTLTKLVENVYMDVECCKDDTVGDVDVESEIADILELVCKYIYEKEIKLVERKDGKYYDIPVNEFRGIFRETVYKNSSYSAIKKVLHSNDYIYYASNRADNTVADVGKVISIIGDAPDVEEILMKISSEAVMEGLDELGREIENDS